MSQQVSSLQPALPCPSCADGRMVELYVQRIAPPACRIVRSLTGEQRRRKPFGQNDGTTQPELKPHTGLIGRGLAYVMQ